MGLRWRSPPGARSFLPIFAGRGALTSAAPLGYNIVGVKMAQGTVRVW
jgi:hypothetical protein